MAVHHPPPIAASSGPTAGFRLPGGFVGRRSNASHSTQAFVASSDFPVAPHADMLHANTTLDGEESDVLVDGPGTPLPTGDPVAAFSVPYNLMNDNIVFDLYNMAVTSYMAASMELLDAMSFIASSPSLQVNVLLDSGSSHHIIWDHSMFSSYDPLGATSVQTANCGSLHALASGVVSFRLAMGDHSVTVNLRNCLHAPDVPINLFSVGTLQHHRLAIRFEPGSPTSFPHTNLIFPPNHPFVPNLSIAAVIVNTMSFLHCDFIQHANPSAFPALSPGTTALSPPSSLHFSPPPLSPSLWHHRLGHLGQDAVCALLT